MSDIRPIVLGSITERLIRAVFESKICQESSNDSREMWNLATRTMKIKELQTQIFTFLKNNPNTIFTLIIPEYSIQKNIQLTFASFITECDDNEEDFSQIAIEIDESFMFATITKKSKIGKNIVMKIQVKQ